MKDATRKIIAAALAADGTIPDAVARDALARLSGNAPRPVGRLLRVREVAALSGIGMMIGISLKTKDAHDVMLRANDAGLLVLTAKEKVRLLPPLTVTKEEMDAGLAILRRVLET